MQLSEFIQKLQAIQAKHGNLCVVLPVYNGSEDELRDAAPAVVNYQVEVTSETRAACFD